jgi:hypothetical protein
VGLGFFDSLPLFFSAIGCPSPVPNTNICQVICDTASYRYITQSISVGPRRFTAGEEVTPWSQTLAFSLKRTYIYKYVTALQINLWLYKNVP